MGRKNFWILLIMLLAGIVLGGFMGQLANGIGAYISVFFCGVRDR